MARIKRAGLNLMDMITRNFKAEEVLPAEFSQYKKEETTHFDNYMY